MSPRPAVIALGAFLFLASLALYFRFEIVAGPGAVVYRMDRLTGSIARCLASGQGGFNCQ